MTDILETHLPDFNHKLTYVKHKYPVCSCGNCPKFFWNMLSIASRMTGKTYSLVQLIKHYEKNTILDEHNRKVELRTFLISPTIDSEANQIFHALKSIDFENDTYDTYNDETLLEIIEDIKRVKKECEDYDAYCDAFKKYSKLEEYELHKLDNDSLKILLRYDFQDPRDIIEFQNMKYKRPPVNIVVLDDCMASGAFTNRAKSALTNAVIKNRHLGLCFAILVQSLKAVPKSIRLNCSVFFLGKFQNKKVILEDLYEEVSNVLTPDQFEKLYEFATDKKYGSLIIDCTDGKRFLQGWDTQLSFGEKKISV